MLTAYYPNNVWERWIHSPWRVLRRVPWRDILDREKRLDCNICGWRGPYIVRGRRTDDPHCPLCKSANRHRLIAWYLTRARPDLVAPGRRFLHVAPERSLGTCIGRIPGLIYESCDLASAGVTYRVDLQREIAGETPFDTIMINHVLEHVQDDRAALRNLFRMLRPGGLCLVTVPLRPNGRPTDEDPTVVDPNERGRRFGQPDHVRYYGFDIVDRIADQGFTTEVLYSAQADPAAVARHTMANEILFLASRPK